MKKQLLFGSALLAAITAYSQNTVSKPKPSGIINMAEKISMKFNAVEPQGNAKLNIPASIQASTAKDAAVSNVNATSISWKQIAGSANIFGMLISQTRPLQYNDDLNAISFIHRKSATYVGSPANNTGVIVGEISSNWGSTWDSTCLYSASAIVGRYPQGGIYNPVGNTNIANAYAIATGPSTDGASNWMGNFYASKQLNAFNSTASAVPNAMQVISNQATSYSTAQFGPQLFSYGFSSTDDGIVHSVAPVFATQQSKIRAARIVKGTFNAGVFNWLCDSVSPVTVPDSSNAPNLYPRPIMAWNEAGTVGYVVILGVLNTACLSNRGYQPIVYKTTNSGTSWALINSIEFNGTAANAIKNPLASVRTNTNLIIPFFKVDEGFDCVVDANNKLHIVSAIIGSAKAHRDSLLYSYSFTTTINPNDGYSWSHTPGDRPYLYDFVGDGSGSWGYRLIDSLGSEGPASRASDPATAGFAENPWLLNAADKVEIDSRIQIARTPNGQYLTYTWAESDSNFTNGQKKWNNIPNVKTRCLNVTTGLLSTTELNVTKYSVAQGTINPNVQNRATCHFISPTTGSAAVTGSTVDIKTPFTVSNSNPLDPGFNNITWFSSNTLSYSNFTINNLVSLSNVGVPAQCGTTGIKIANNSISSNINIYPNPTSNNAILEINAETASAVTVSIYNLVGALVKTVNFNATVGSNSVNLDLTNLNSGIYITNVKVGNSVSTKKLIIE